MGNANNTKQEIKIINEDIKNKTFKNMYLLYGEEKYMILNQKKSLISAIVPENENMNVSKYDGADIDTEEVISVADTMPFFAERRLILIENSGWLKNSNDAMADYLKKVPETTVFLFVEEDVDKRSRVYKQIKANGCVAEINRYDRNDLVQWVVKGLGKYNKKITVNNVNYFLDRVGDDMNILYLEINKLAFYTGDREIVEKEDIDEVCTLDITSKIFDMIDAIGKKQQKKAMELYYDCIASREAPLKILALIIRQFNQMYQVAEMNENYISSDEMAKNLSMNPYIVKKILQNSKNFSVGTLKKAVKYCVSMEEAVKTGNLDEKMAVELIIVRYSR